MGDITTRNPRMRGLQDNISEKVNVVVDTFTNLKEVKLNARYWQPKGEILGSVFLCHGFGEHLGWYEGLAQQLADKGLLVFGHDHQGHGRSEGKRAFIETVDDYVQDVLRHCGEVKVEYPGLPMFIYGHSMGGMITVSTVIRNSSFFKGMILEGPLIIPDPAEVTPTRLLLGKLMSTILPEMQMGRIRVEQMTSDTEVQARLTSDKLRWTGGVKLGLGMAFLRCLESIHKNMNAVSLPFLIVHGENDSLCQPAGSHLLAREAKSKDKKLKIYPGASHHLILEEKKVRDEVISDIVSWVLQKLAPLKTATDKITSL